jgi:internalin A
VNPLKDLTALTDLWLSGNSISDVKALSNLTHLTRLYLAENPISDTSPLYPLLSANGGKITDIDRVVSE